MESWESGKVFNVSVNIPFTSAVIDQLIPVTKYDVRLFSSDEFGLSYPTETLKVLTLPEAPSGEPRNVSAIPLGPNVIIVKWEPPDLALQNGEILGYEITATIQSYSSGRSNKHKNLTVFVDQTGKMQAELKERVPNSQYKIWVKAYNSAGVGPASPYLFIHTPEGGLQCKRNHIFPISSFLNILSTVI